ncbi:MAG: hypothetical protein ACSHYF_05495 [Verrucomicrobiaceae bacterium]
MKTTIIIAAASALAFGLNSCAGTTADPHAGHNMSATGVKSYPSDKCIVTDNKLGSMGDPITIVHKGQEVKFCCKPCVAKFNANPEKYLAKL